MEKKYYKYIYNRYNIDIYYIYYKYYVNIYMPSICRQQQFRSLRDHQYSSDQKKILKDQIAQTTARVVSVAYRSHIYSAYVYIYIYALE